MACGERGARSRKRAVPFDSLRSLRIVHIGRPPSTGSGFWISCGGDVVCRPRRLGGAHRLTDRSPRCGDERVTAHGARVTGFGVILTYCEPSFKRILDGILVDSNRRLFTVVKQITQAVEVHMPAKTTFGDHVRTLRVNARLGLREAAGLLDISPGYLSRFEAGEARPPSGDVLHRMAKVYECDIRELMDRAQNRAAEVISADQTGAGPLAQAFYRLAQDQSRDKQELMLSAAIDALEIAPEQKRAILDKLRAMLAHESGPEMYRLAGGDLGMFAKDVRPRFLSAAQIESIATRLLASQSDGRLTLPVPIEEIIDGLGPEVQLIIDPEIEGGRLRDGSPAVLGLSRWSKNGERRELVIHEDLFDTEDESNRRRCRFTLAHELFHCVEHLSLVQDRTVEYALQRRIAYVSLAPRLTSIKWFDRKRKPKVLQTNEDWREWQANTFAGALLMPADPLRVAFAQATGRDCLKGTSGETPQQLADRLARLPYVDPQGQLGSLADRFDVNPQPMAIRLLGLGLVKS